ncbi:MAG: hypothetical protein ACRC41_03540 [Sarcina sp.]
MEVLEKNLTEFEGISIKKIGNLKYFSEINLQNIYNLEKYNFNIKKISKITIDYVIKNIQILNLESLLLVDIEFYLKINYISLNKKVEVFDLLIPHISYIKLNEKLSKILISDLEIHIKNVYYNLIEKNLLIHIYGINLYM